jgi:DNA polymerase-3 subunit gamma/tau
MRGTTAPRLLLELVCARVLLPAASHDASAVLTRIERLERRFDIAAPAAPAPPAAAPANPAATPAAAVPADAAPSRPVALEPPRVDTAPVAGRNQPPPESDAGAAPAPVAAADVPREDATPDGSPAAPVAPSAWPQTAPPGGLPATAAATPPPAADGPTGGLDTAALRLSWDAVLDAVKERKKTTHAQLLNARVLSLQGSRLTLAFTHAPVMRQFQNGVSAEVLKDALQASLGIALDITCVVNEGAAAEPVAGAAPQRAATEGFAPGDEAAPEDPDEPASPDPGLHGEDAALRLVENELGGKVVGTRGE